MVKNIGRLRLARWRHLFAPGGGMAASWVGKRFLLSIEVHYEDRREQ